MFIFLLTLWTLGSALGVNATATALAGVAAMLATGALSWQDILEERNGQDTFIWFAVLVMMATGGSSSTDSSPGSTCDSDNRRSTRPDANCSRRAERARACL